jgi:hypothetical protein
VSTSKLKSNFWDARPERRETTTHVSLVVAALAEAEARAPQLMDKASDVASASAPYRREGTALARPSHHDATF